jgi:hypothetical protein
MSIVKPSAVKRVATGYGVRLQLLAVDFRRGAEGARAGRQDCGPRDSSEALPYSRLARRRGQATFLVYVV